MLRSIPGRIINFCVKHAAVTATATLAITLVLAFFALKVEINPDFVSFLPENSEVNRTLREYSGNPTTTDLLVLAVAAGSGSVFDADKLSAYGGAVASIGGRPEVISVVSPFNLVSFGRAGGRLAIRTMSPGGIEPASDALPEFRARLAGARYATNLVVSADSTMLISYFQVARGSSSAGLMTAVNGEAARLRAAGLTPYVTGSLPLSVQTGFYLSRDISRLLALAVLLVVLCYALGFRMLRGIVLPLASVLFGTVWTVGFMGMMGYSLSLISVVVPPLIMIFGNEYNIFTTSEFRRLRGTPGAGGPRIAEAGRNVAKPITMAFLSTLVGFLSLMVTDIPQTREFAIAASFGSLACAFLALVFLPALFALFAPLAPPAVKQGSRFARAMRWLARFSWRFPAVVLAGVGAIVVLFVLTWPRIVFNTDSANYYPQKDAVLLDTYSIYGKVGGYEQISVSFDAPGGAAGYFLDSAVLMRVEQAERALRALPDVSYAISLPDLLREISRASTGVDAIPANRVIISTFARLLAASGANSATGSALGNLANKDFSRLTISLRIYNSTTGRFMDEARFRDLVASMQKILDANPVATKAVIWGDLMRSLAFADSLRRTLFLSMAISFISILLLTIIVFRSPLFGLYPLIPLAAGLLVNFAVMSLTGIPLDLTTIMVSNIAIGVGVDSAIYLVIQYRRELRATPRDAPAALERTLEVMGQPVLLASVSIIAGLLVFLTAAFRPVMFFGVLVVVTLAATTVGTLITLPALLGLDARVRRARALRRSGPAR